MSLCRYVHGFLPDSGKLVPKTHFEIISLHGPLKILEHKTKGRRSKEINREVMERPWHTDSCLPGIVYLGFVLNIFASPVG